MENALEMKAHADRLERLRAPIEEVKDCIRVSYE